MSEYGKKGGKTTQSNKTPEQRLAHSNMMVRARLKKAKARKEANNALVKKQVD